MRARARVCFKGKLMQVMNTNAARLGVTLVQNTACHNLKVIIKSRIKCIAVNACLFKRNNNSVSKYFFLRIPFRPTFTLLTGLIYTALFLDNS